MISKAFVYVAVLLSERPNEETLRHTVGGFVIRQAKAEGNPIGKGLFVQTRGEAAVEPGTIVTQYPCAVRAILQEECQSEENTNTYVLYVSGIQVQYVNLDGTAESRKGGIVFDGSRYLGKSKIAAGGYINTSHPRSLEEKYRVPNCVWGFWVPPEVLDRPVMWGPLRSIEVFVVSSQFVGRGEQFLLDYHWQLAGLNGLWCLDRHCENCRAELLKFCMKL